MEILLIMAVFIGLMYFMTVRPQKKRMEEQRKMLEALQPGSRVLLNSGIFGTIRATADQQMVVELAPGVEVTVLRQAVMRAAKPDEEEFEFTDDQAAVAADSFRADDIDRSFAEIVEGDANVIDQPVAEAAAAATDETEEAAGEADEAASDAIYKPGENVIYQPGSNEVSATDDAGERPQER